MPRMLFSRSAGTFIGPGESVVCDAMLRISYISVPLKAAVAGRVLVDEQGKAGMVCPETGDC